MHKNVRLPIAYHVIGHPEIFIGFSAKLKILKDFNQIEGFKGSTKGLVLIVVITREG